MRYLQRKLTILAFIAILVMPQAIAEEALDLEKYLECFAEKKVDIVFVFDTTSSMCGEISELSAIIRDFAADLEASHIDYRLGLVEFKDFSSICEEIEEGSCGSLGDFAYRVKNGGNLTDNVSIFVSWMHDLHPIGGGDDPEAILAALRHAASDCHWRRNADKALVLLTDSIPHPDGDSCNAEGDTLQGTIFELTNNSACVHVIGPDDEALKKIANDTGGRFLQILSGLSLKPLLKDITEALNCRFGIEVNAYCINSTIKAEAQLVGIDVIPYVRGKTEAWMYLDQIGNSSRLNLSYDSAAGAYLAEVPEICGPAKLIVFGRVEERSAAKSVHVECGYCGAVASAMQSLNQPPAITSLFPEPASPQDAGSTIRWTAEANDPEGDQLLYRFFLNDEPITGWVPQNQWIWTAHDPGSYRIKVLARDGKHAGPEGMDDQRFYTFEIVAPLHVEESNTSLNPAPYRNITAPILGVAFSPDGGTIASGNWDGTIKLWDTASGGELQTLSGHSDWVLSVAFSPDGRMLASGSWDGIVKLWDTSSGAELRELAANRGYVKNMAFCPDGRILASGSGNAIYIWDLVRGSLIWTLEGHNLPVFSLAFSPDARILASGSLDGTIKLWDKANGTELRTLKNHSASVLSVIFSPDGRTLASGSLDGTIKLWDVATGSQVQTLELTKSGQINSVALAFSSDGRTLASWYRQYNSAVKIWDVASGFLNQTVALPNSFEDVAFSPDGHKLASRTNNVSEIFDNAVKVWDIANGRLCYTTKHQLRDDVVFYSNLREWY